MIQPVSNIPCPLGMGMFVTLCDDVVCSKRSRSVAVGKSHYKNEKNFGLSSSFYRRFFAEIFLFLRHNPDVTHWQAVVIFERRSLEPKAVQRIPFLTLLESSQIHRIYLEDFRELPANSVEAAILQLIVTKPKTAVQKAKVLIDQARDRNDSDLY